MELEKFARIIGEVLNLDPKTIRMDMDFVEDLGADSLDMYQIMISAEEELQQEIDAEDAEKVRTVKDALELFDRLA